MDRRLVERIAVHERSDEGSILPLALGYAAIALLLIYVCVCATSLYLGQKELDAAADAAALAGSDGFSLTLTERGPTPQLNSASVRDQALALVEISAIPARVDEAFTPDGVSARVSLSTTWHPPFLAPFVPEGIPLAATATSRTALR
ncbi:hypothetical protein FHX48_002463 [Microbacterium halimionae]|uniref:Putative Flp pilus-assembly TadG-like N-terminal domain-containing protein n=1 Tax=Microbacterium halimionae TaxID=1526413 RepID=A0A7W3PMW8_9MICO|nr:pilus assembly protein TadG-related protein [Microbacterium halimionae]MBA8817364.1 hypothetical protein [Microbacterium halimionae]NII95998.1 hypothetical protein [Microbacterium halimionae]